MCYSCHSFGLKRQLISNKERKEGTIDNRQYNELTSEEKTLAQFKRD